MIPHTVFSLCFAPNGGYFAVGGVNNTFHTEPEIKYIPFYASNLYKVKLGSISLNNNEVEISNNYYTVIDSGTTISYFPRRLYNDLERYINQFCSQINRCLGDSYTSDIGFCFKVKDNISTAQFVESMPTLYFTFESKVQVPWKPENYLYNSTDSGNDARLTYCMGFTSWSTSELLLGSTWMHNRDVIFDVQDKQIGLVNSRCHMTSQDKPGMMNISVDKKPSSTSCDSLVNFYFYLVIIITIFFVCIIVILLYALRRFRKGQKFLWMQIQDESGN